MVPYSLKYTSNDDLIYSIVNGDLILEMNN